MNSTKKSSGGFTLLEVLVALTIIAIALGALLNTSGTQVSSTTYLKQKTLAHWVAVNELTQIQIAGEFPDLGDQTGSTEMADHVWYWKRTTKQTEDEDAREVTFKVFVDDDYEEQVSTLVGFATR